MRLKLRPRVDLVAWALLAAIFAVDLRFPAGFAVNLFYTGVILLALRTPDPNFALKLAGVATVLTLLDRVLSPIGGNAAVEYFNRGVGTLVVWLTAIGVTSHRRAAGQQEAARQRTQEYLDIVSVIVLVLDRAGRIKLMNRRGAELLGAQEDELIGQLWIDGFIPPDDRPRWRDTLTAICGGYAASGGFHRSRVVARDGAISAIAWNTVMLSDHRGTLTGTLSSGEDITLRLLAEEERGRADAALREQDSLAQLGKMAAVVAHEVRNPLAGIRGALQVIGRRLPEGGREREIAGEIITRIDTLDTIVQDLLEFARPRQPVLSEISVDSLVQETTALMTDDPRMGEVTIRIEQGQVAIRADRELLKLVLHNLLINGAQAMAQQGEILVTTHQVDGWMELRITDTGPGIPAAVREHLFEPFYTTKHRGTGLGLATARRIIEAHQGTLELECPGEGGTTAVVRLPAS